MILCTKTARRSDTLVEGDQVGHGELNEDLGSDGTVSEAVEVAKTGHPDVIVVQGADGGRHGLQHRPGIISLLPEVCDALNREGPVEIPVMAAGGIMDGRGAAAALTLGASGVCLGTRFLACEEATVMKGYQDEVLRVSDGGVSTVATTVYDLVRAIYG